MKPASAPWAGGGLHTARPQVLCPRAPVGVCCAPDIFGHLKHHFRLHCPHELRMVVCEVSLHCIEELLIGLSCELRPALAVGDPSMRFVDRGHMAWSLQ